MVSVAAERAVEMRGGGGRLTRAGPIGIAPEAAGLGGRSVGITGCSRG